MNEFKRFCFCFVFRSQISLSLKINLWDNFLGIILIHLKFSVDVFTKHSLLVTYIKNKIISKKYIFIYSYIVIATYIFHNSFILNASWSTFWRSKWKDSLHKTIIEICFTVVLVVPVLCSWLSLVHWVVDLYLAFPTLYYNYIHRARTLAILNRE